MQSPSLDVRWGEALNGISALSYAAPTMLCCDARAEIFKNRCAQAQARSGPLTITQRTIPQFASHKWTGGFPPFHPLNVDPLTKEEGRQFSGPKLCR